MFYSVDRVATINFSKDEFIHITTVMILMVTELPLKVIPTYTGGTIDEVLELLHFIKKQFDNQIYIDFQLSEFDLVILLRSSGAIAINGLVNKYTAISGLSQNDINSFINKIKAVMDNYNYSL